MLKISVFILTVIFSLAFGINNVYAIVDPLSVPNNKFGVHILFTQELEKARELINSNGGDWGYITIPIQAGDKDLEKWQKFMNDAKQLHLIPIIRIATENYYFDTRVWRKPTGEDILDFANFLNSLEWPVKNRYVVIFNEVNRADEWEGNPNPGEYAQVLDYSLEIFKSLNPDFFIISAGLDNASSNIPEKSMNQYNFMRSMNEAAPGIFDQIDGLGSHSYPNPGFSQPPSSVTNSSISSFKFEKDLISQFSDKNLPVFITETGWSREKVSENNIASYFMSAFDFVWSDPDVIAVTPFLLQAGTGPFFQFSLLKEDGNYNNISQALLKIKKTKGEPAINIYPLSVLSPSNSNIAFETFSYDIQYENSGIKRVQAVKPFFKWLLKL